MGNRIIMVYDLQINQCNLYLQSKPTDQVRKIEKTSNSGNKKHVRLINYRDNR